MCCDEPVGGLDHAILILLLVRSDAMRAHVRSGGGQDAFFGDIDSVCFIGLRTLRCLISVHRTGHKL